MEGFTNNKSVIDYVVQENHYYPFGMLMNGFTAGTNPYTYNGQETQPNTGFLDYGFRQLDPQLGRWHAVDKLAEMYPSVSPYAYVSNNPISNYDVLGLTQATNITFHPAVQNMIEGLWNLAGSDGWASWSSSGGVSSGGEGTFQGKTPALREKGEIRNLLAGLGGGRRSGKMRGSGFNLFGGGIGSLFSTTYMGGSPLMGGTWLPDWLIKLTTKGWKEGDKNGGNIETVEIYGEKIHKGKVKRPNIGEFLTTYNTVAGAAFMKEAGSSAELIDDAVRNFNKTLKAWGHHPKTLECIHINPGLAKSAKILSYTSHTTTAIGAIASGYHIYQDFQNGDKDLAVFHIVDGAVGIGTSFIPFPYGLIAWGTWSLVTYHVDNPKPYISPYEHPNIHLRDNTNVIIKP